jgi:aminocarboxymuconate-semialdehyde decarboxylase
MQQGQAAYPDRIRYFATLPWQHAELAVEELARACDNGAVGVMVLANIRGMTLIDPSFSLIWKEIDRRGLPVLVHPTTPPGTPDMGLGRLLPSVGFTFDTSLAISNMIMDGFLDQYPNLSIIASHGGGTLPYLAGRLDLFFEKRYRPEERKIAEPPSQHLGRIYYDSIVYQPTCLKLCVEMGGPERVLFGTDYPHPANIPYLMDLVDDLPRDQVAAVKGGNAVRLFKL